MEDTIQKIIERIQEVPAMYITQEQETLLIEKEHKKEKITKQQRKYPGFYTYIVKDYITFTDEEGYEYEDTLYHEIIKNIMVACVKKQIPAFCIKQYNEKEKLIKLSLHPVLKSLQRGNIQIICKETDIRHVNCAVLPYSKLKNIC